MTITTTSITASSIQLIRDYTVVTIVNACQLTGPETLCAVP